MFIMITLLLTGLVLTEVSARTNFDDNKEVPLSRSLGYAIRSSLGKSLEDEEISRKYLELYQEMMKASQEAYDKVNQEEARLETIVGKENADLLKRGVLDRRSITHTASAAGRRRVRSQMSRRERLNNQSLRRHLLPTNANNDFYE